MKRLALQVALFALTMCCGSSAIAAEQAIVLRGVIEKLDGPVVSIKTQYGAPAKFMLGPSPHVIAAEKLPKEAIKPGAIVHIVRSPTGTKPIVEVQVFSENSDQLLRDILDPGSASGLVRELTASNDGYRISTIQGAEEKQVIVPTETPVVAYVSAEAEGMKVGAAVLAANGKKMPDGLVQMGLLVYGRDGAVPNL